LVAAGGRILALVRIPNVTNHPEPGVAEQDPDTWWDGVVRATRELSTIDEGALHRVDGRTSSVGTSSSPALRCTMSGLLEGNRAPLGGYEGWSAHVEHGAAGETATDGLKDAARVDARLLRQIPGNTYVIFTSDHGEMLGDHYRYHKSAGYEGSARIPLLISGPGIEACTVREEPAGWHDILPTILDYAGVDCPERVDGRSMRPLSRIAPGDLCETGASVPRLK
jgi:hypothetical protein